MKTNEQIARRGFLGALLAIPAAIAGVKFARAEAEPVADLAETTVVNDDGPKRFGPDFFAKEFTYGDRAAADGRNVESVLFNYVVPGEPEIMYDYTNRGLSICNDCQFFVSGRLIGAAGDIDFFGDNVVVARTKGHTEIRPAAGYSFASPILVPPSIGEHEIRVLVTDARGSDSPMIGVSDVGGQFVGRSTVPPYFVFHAPSPKYVIRDDAPLTLCIDGKDVEVPPDGRWYRITLDGGEQAWYRHGLSETA